MKRSFICLIILFLAGSAVEGRSQQGKGKRKKPLMAKLTVYPAKDSKAGQKYQLLVKLMLRGYMRKQQNHYLRTLTQNSLNSGAIHHLTSCPASRWKRRCSGSKPAWG